MKIFLLLFLAAVFISCSDENVTPDIGAQIEDRQIVLGEKLPNPYSLSVMQKAADELADGSSLKAAVILQPTHYYLRFAPRDTAEIDLLEADTTVFFYNYPMDYEIVREGDTYTDLNVPDGTLKYMYCAVEVNHKLPNVPCEVLDELYILEETNVFVNPAEDEDESEEGNKSAQNDYWEALEMKAKEIVGAEISQNKSKWRPQGDVYYHDTAINKDIPLYGVPVRCRKSLFVTHQCCTDERGHFSFGRLRGRVDYYIRWRRDNFKIREHTGLDVAETNLRSNTKSSVTYTVKHGTRTWEYATIFRAAHFYYYKARDYGLSSPTKNSLTLRPSAKYEPGLNGRYNSRVIKSDIHIYCMDDNSAEVFCTTTHEIAHSVMQFWNVFNYNNYNDKMRDTWAEGIAWFLTGRIYDIPLFDSHLHYEGDLQYTPLVKYLYRDCDFTMAQIEKGFKSRTSWDALKLYFKKLKPERNADINEAFARCE